MKTEHISQFYQTLSSDNLCFVYQGDFSDNITEKIISLSEHSMDSDQDLMKIKNKISFLIVECFQNIVRHGNDAPSKTNRTVTFPGLFSTRSRPEYIYISSANLIENNHIIPLKEKLDKLNSLDKEQMKALYVDILSNKELSDKGGAGLGLVEMARKSGNPLEFSFESENDKLSLFYLMLKMKGKKEEVEQKAISMHNLKQMHETMRRENILMVYKGDFSQETIIPLLKMIEENLNNHIEELTVKKKLYLILVEILQNVSKHSFEIEGKREAIFMIGKSDQKFIIGTGNMIDAVSAEKLMNKINKVNSLSKEELKGLYKTTLKDGISTEGGAGLGIIDIARECSEKLVFDIKTEGGQTAFFSLGVQI